MFQKPLKNWTKGPTESPVSEADIAVNDLLRRAADRARTTTRIAWLSEESVDDPARLAARYVWIVDPIDGTRAYIAGLPDWTVSVALVEHGRPIAACLYAPVTAEFFMRPRQSRRHAQRRGDRGQHGRGASSRRASPGRESCWSACRRSRRLSRSCRGCARWRCGLPGSRKARSTPPLPAATATTGTLRRLIFWCTKRAAH